MARLDVPVEDVTVTDIEMIDGFAHEIVQIRQNTSRWFKLVAIAQRVADCETGYARKFAAYNEQGVDYFVAYGFMRDERVDASPNRKPVAAVFEEIPDKRKL